ncbi:MAG: quinohemoprotein amine dehydrogenase subunit alpha [Bryobacterales bacterium]|nr:quinohemoprotein amine dehydrogenase subunit alpha [Bryobacterales bacterium]
MIRITKALLPIILLLTRVAGQSPAPEEGIPVTDPLVIAKCGPCHAKDDRGNLERISWMRTTPEGWQEALRKTVLDGRLTIAPAEARAVVKSLSGSHGLAPEEAQPVAYYAERRIQEEGIDDDNPLTSCTKCHPAARPLSWRRSPKEWEQFVETHAKEYKFDLNPRTITALSKTTSLHTPEWTGWSARTARPDLSGRWLVTAHLHGGGKYTGELQVERGSAPDEFSTRIKLKSTKNGFEVVRTGQTVIFGGYQWRGRSRGVNPPNSPEDASNEARESLWFSPDLTRAEGRWFWGQYQEFGFNVELRRPSTGATLLAIDSQSLKIGSKSNAIRLIGDNFAAQVSPADLSFGPGVTVRRIVSGNATEIVVEVDVAANATPRKNDVSLHGSVLKGRLAIYDRVDYLKVTPESSLAAFGNANYQRGFGIFEAIGFQRGPDGKAHTADDLDLGPIDATWSMEVFYAVDSSGNDKIGKVSTAGLFTPAADNPGVNYDIWVIATAVKEFSKDARPLVGKGYVVVTVPEYTFNGRRYIRDLDRWIEEGTW